MKEKILAVLEQNSRISLEELAAKVGVRAEEAASAIDLMEQEHVICGYNALINWDKVDQERVVALIEVKVTPQRDMGFDTIAERIYQYPEVQSVYLMSGGFDFTVIVQSGSMRSVANFVSEKLAPIDSVLSTATHFILKKYKDYGTILSDGPKDEREMFLS